MTSMTDHTQRTAPSKFTLEVVSGLHSGVSLILDKAEYRIGSTPQSDIVLRDAGLEPDHAIIRVERGDVRIEAIGGDVSLSTGLLSQGNGCRLRLPAELSIGAARIRIAGPDVSGAVINLASHAGNFSAVKTAVAAGGILCCAFAISVVAHTAVQPVSEVGAWKRTAELQGQGDKGMQPVQKKQSQELAAEAARQMNERLTAAGVGSLKATAGDGRLSVSGALSSRQTAVWTDVQQWFDQTYGNRLTLTANVGVSDALSQGAPVLRVQAIWYGEHPYVLTEEGARYEQGAFLDNGWVLREIGENSILLAREGETFTIAYR